MKNARIQIYTGDGKGKTTASIGLAVRCAGSGKKVMIAQFLKGTYTSEMAILNGIDNIELFRASDSKKFVWLMGEDEKQRMKKLSHELIERSKLWIADDSVDMIIFDEILGALSVGFVTKEDILDILSMDISVTELVLTGRDAPSWLIDRADLVSEIKCVKHYMDAGVKARKGIEF